MAIWDPNCVLFPFLCILYLLTSGKRDTSHSFVKHLVLSLNKTENRIRVGGPIAAFKTPRSWQV